MSLIHNYDGAGRGRSGFLLIEAVASVVIISICLVWIVQALLMNLRAGTVFQDRTRAIFAAENHLGTVFASPAFDGGLIAGEQDFAAPYSGLSLRTTVDNADPNLITAVFKVMNASGKTVLTVPTLIFKSDQTKSSAVIDE